MKSLSFPEMEYRYHSIDPALTGTCQWFLDHSLYKDWLKNNRTPNLCPSIWLRGKPGAGKSTIIKMAVDNAKSVAHASGRSGSTTIVAGMFFNSRGAVLECNLEGFFRSILHQLFETQVLELDSEPLTLFLRKSSLLSEGWKWTIGELRTMFQRTVARPGLDIILFIDALDECEESQIRVLISFLANEMDLAQHAGSLLRICVSSRHYPNVSTRSCHTVIAEQHNGIDIKAYVESQMPSIHNNLASIVDKITQESSGVFLWTTIVVRKMLEAIEDGESMSALLEILASTPLDLEAIFEALLSSINGNEREEARSILLFVLFAKRPMSLAELTIAFSFRKQYSSLRAYLDSPDFTSYKQMSKLITKRTRGLVEVKNTSTESIVQFIHGSVREYFLRNPSLLLSTATTHAHIEAFGNHELARSCFSFVRVPDCMVYNDDLKTIGISYHPLVRYAGYYAFQHAREAEACGRRQCHIAEILGLNVPDPKQWTPLPEYFNSNCPTDAKLSNLSLCCKNHLLSVVETLLPASSDDEIAVSALVQPLCAAAAAGRSDIVSVLLAKGARVNDLDKFYGSALHASVAEGHVEVSRRLLCSGATVDARSEQGTALIIASMKGDEAHVHLLLEHTANVQLIDDKYGNALLATASEGHIEIVRILLHYGANLSTLCRYWNGHYARKETHPLEEASYWGHEGVLSLLLEAANPIELPKSYYKDALSAAVSAHNTNCIRLVADAARPKFGPIWSAASLSAIKRISRRQSRDEIEIDVRGVYSTRITPIRIRSNLQCIDLKSAIRNVLGTPPNEQYLVISRPFYEGGVRKINEQEYLCDRAVTNGTRIEVLPPVKSCGGHYFLRPSDRRQRQEIDDDVSDSSEESQSSSEG